jgi:hypothetical protein
MTRRRSARGAQGGPLPTGLVMTPLMAIAIGDYD